MAILAQSYQGINGGMNQAVPQHEIPDGQASYMQDIILSTPGIIKRRGPLTKYSGSTTVPFRATGMAATQDPTGAYKTVVFAGDATHAYAYFYSADLTSKVGPYTITTGLVFDPANPRIIVDAKPALGGGTLIGMSNSYVPSSTTKAALFLWRGASMAADIPTTAINCTVTAGSTTVTAASPAFGSVTAGMFVKYVSRIVGVVKSVTSTTALELEAPATVSSTGVITFTPFANVAPALMKGRISASALSRYVNGTQGPAGTKFKSAVTADMIANSDGFVLSRLSDNTVVYTASNASNLVDNATIDADPGGAGLSITATVGLTNERYKGTPRLPFFFSTWTLDIMGSTYVNSLYTSVGFLNAVWNGRQWYANRPIAGLGDDLMSRLWFSDPAALDGLDLDPNDGDFMDIASSGTANTPIVAIQGIPAGLCVFKENELFLVTGSDYTNFSVRKIADTGTLATGSVQTVGSGVIWAGREGIFYFDGNALRNLTAQLGDYWTQSIKGFNTSTARMGSYVWKNQYVLFVDSFASTYTLRKAAATTTPTTATFSINLDTFAITTFTNVAIKDSSSMPSGSGIPTLFLVDDGGTPGTTSVIDASLIHSATGTGPDTITCGGQTLGPDFYIETKKYDMGDPERKKLFKQLAMNYTLAGNTLSMDTVPGLNTTGTAINTAWATQSTWTNLRKKFTKRDTHLQFRFYQTSSAVTDVQIGPLSIGFKLQRVGRV